MKYLFLFLLLWPLGLQGQGCSDAGFCTMGAMKPDQKFYKQKPVRLLAIELSQYFGTTRLNDQSHATTLDANIGIGQKNTLQVKLPYLINTGRLGSNQGLGDISLSFTRSLFSSEKQQFQATLGMKIPTSDARQRNAEGLELPMFYQSSLGTFDLVAGISYINRQWLFAAGIQHPLNRVENGFQPSAWDSSELAAEAAIYPVSNQLQRGTDVMLRIERNFRFSRFNFHLGLLPIYRVKGDVVSNPTRTERFEVDSTTGLALSALLGFGYHFNTKVGLKGLLGRRIVEREKNPDGLYREFVSSLGIEWRF